MSLKAKRRRLFWVRFCIVLFFLLVIIFGLAILSGHEKMTIKTFLLSGNDSVADDQILKIANQDMSGRYLGLFAKNNFLIFPRFTIERDLLAQIKTLKEVDISWKSWQTVSISVSERKPHSVWCGPDPAALNQTCYFVDITGYIFGQAPSFSGDLFVKDYSLLNQPNPIASSFLPPLTYSQIFALIDLLDKKGLEVKAVSFDGFDYTFVLNTGPTIIFNDKNGGFNTAFQNLFTAIDSKNLDLLGGVAKIKYVDLRIESKVVVGKKSD